MIINELDEQDEAEQKSKENYNAIDHGIFLQCSYTKSLIVTLSSKRTTLLENVADSVNVATTTSQQIRDQLIEARTIKQVLSLIEQRTPLA